MEADFWHQRWQDNLIGFHQHEVNPYLLEYWPQLELEESGGVLVPLCGKSLDMRWLAERHNVHGVELSPQAVEDFFAEQQLQSSRREAGGFSVCEATGITLYCGDFFNLSSAVLGNISAVYDRAALIALPPVMRARYVSHLNSLCPAGTQMLLVTMAYNQAEMDGPPFSVEDAEVHELFGAHWRVERLREDDILENEAKFRERGLGRLSENIYRLRKN
ncbi:thiopurine S-methyltransferase [Pseudomonadota bacterium]